jgi:hypothetical protein
MSTQVLSERSQVTIRCTLDSPRSNITIPRWAYYKNDRRIPTPYPWGVNTRISRTSHTMVATELRIGRVGGEHQGVYACKAGTLEVTVHAQVQGGQSCTGSWEPVFSAAVPTIS